MFQFSKRTTSLVLFLFAIILSLFSYFPELKHILTIKERLILASYGDHPIIINPQLAFINKTYVLNDAYGGGFNDSFNVGHLIPFLAFLYLANLFNIGPNFATILYLVVINTVGILGFALFCRHFFRKVFHPMSALLFGVIYVYSPFFLSSYHPGHSLIHLLYYTFPIALVLIDKHFKYKILSQKQLYYQYSLLIFLLFLLESSAFTNPAYVIIYWGLLITFIFIKSIISVKNFSPILTSLRYLKNITILFFFASSWWLLPSLVYQATHLSLQAEYSKKTLGSNIAYATQYSLSENILFGSPEKPLEIYNTPSIVVLLGIVLATLAHKKFLYKSRIVAYLFLLFSGAFFITKGPNVPLSFIFRIIYKHLFIFQIFRRPYSKIYWLFLFVITSIAWYGWMLTMKHLTKQQKNKIVKVLLYVPVIITITVYFSYFAFSQKFNLVQIPKEYFTAANFLKADDVHNLLLLPDLNGNLVEYDKSINNFSGIDFLSVVWPYPQYVNDMATRITLKRDIIKKIVSLDSLILSTHNSKSVCQELMNMDITHVILRKNIRNLPFINYSNNLSNIACLTLIMSNTYFDVYRVNDNLHNKNVILVRNADSTLASYTVEKESPVRYTITIPITNTPKVEMFKIQLFKSYDRNWLLLPLNYSLIKAQIFNKAQNVYIKHTKLHDYANEWIVNIPPHSISSGKTEIKLMVFFLPQIYFLLGTSLTLFYLTRLFYLNVVSHSISKY